MTIIVAVKDYDKTIVAADTQAVSKGISTDNVHKLIQIKIPVETTPSTDKQIIDSFLIGISGQASLISLFKSFKPPFKYQDDNFINYMYQHFIPELQSYLYDNNLAVFDLGQIDIESTILIVYHFEIYQLNYNLTLEEISNDYYACGSGKELAYGSLFTSSKSNSPPSKKVILAIQACAEYNIYCNGIIDTCNVYSDGTISDISTFKI